MYLSFACLVLIAPENIKGAKIRRQSNSDFAESMFYHCAVTIGVHQLLGDNTVCGKT